MGEAGQGLQSPDVGRPELVGADHPEPGAGEHCDLRCLSKRFREIRRGCSRGTPVTCMQLATSTVVHRGMCPSLTSEDFAPFRNTAYELGTFGGGEENRTPEPLACHGAQERPQTSAQVRNKPVTRTYILAGSARIHSRPG